jgi:hypothetical protein
MVYKITAHQRGALVGAVKNNETEAIRKAREWADEGLRNAKVCDPQGRLIWSDESDRRPRQGKLRLFEV